MKQVVLKQSLSTLMFFVFFHLFRDCVRERNAGRSSPSFAVSDTAVGVRSPRNQVLLVPDTGEDVTLLLLFHYIDLHF